MSRQPGPFQPRKPEESAVNQKTTAGLNRRSLLKGGLGAVGAGLLGAGVLRPAIAGAAFVRPVPPEVNNPAAARWAHLAATDGWATMPGTKARPPFWPDPLAPSPYNTYVFGFRDVAPLFDLDGAGNTVVGADGYPVISPANQAKLDGLKGKAQISAPIYTFKQDDEVRITLDNLGLLVRPDLVDGHTMHWHGFNNAIPLFDGVPELSVAVPIGRRFVYEFRPRDAGTYMYHCHFEDVEHVQMGMTGILYVRPAQNGEPIAHEGDTFTRFGYNCGDGSTGYHREYSFLLTELWPEAHYRDAHIQVTDWTDFNAAFWLLNGRAYPDTLAPGSSWNAGEADLDSAAGRLRYNPNSSLIRANQGERVLLRMSNLGYQVHTMTLEGAAMRVIAKDASLLRGKQTGGGSVDLSYQTSGVEIGPGESRDVLFRAPAYTTAGSSTDAVGDYNTYLLYDRNFSMRNNNGAAGNGGQMTEVRVYSGSPLGAQSLDVPNS